MNIMHHITAFVYEHLGDSIYYILGFAVIIHTVAMWRLYDKAGQPGVSCLIPVVNILVYLKIIGRPAWHIFLFLVPIYGQLYLIPKTWIELCQSFGKRTLLDYVLVIVLNGLYIFNLGLSYETVYEGPAHGKQLPLNESHPQPLPA